MNMSDTAAVYKLHVVELMRSHFEKNDLAPTSPTAVPEHKLTIDTGFAEKDTYLWVTVTAKVEAELEGKPFFQVEVSMRGLFERSGETALTPDQFGKVNGPAILFPFVREHLANLTLRANLPPVLLPPINFVERAGK
jgi:preprotein translocase subunit SecB